MLRRPGAIASWPPACSTCTVPKIVTTTSSNEPALPWVPSSSTTDPELSRTLFGEPNSITRESCEKNHQHRTPDDPGRRHRVHAGRTGPIRVLSEPQVGHVRR